VDVPGDQDLRIAAGTGLAARIAEKPGHARKPCIVFVGHLAGHQLFGGERSLLDLLATVDAKNYAVGCVLPEGNAAYLQAVAQHAGLIEVFPYGWWTTARPVDEVAVARFQAIFQQWDADLIHVNTTTLMDPLIAARRLGRPSIVHARELITEDPELAGLFGGEPLAIVNEIRSAADYIIANSDTTHQLYRKQEASFRLYNCIDTDAFDLPGKAEPKRLKVGIISNNHPKKGLEDFFALAKLAARSRSDLEFVVIGPHTDLSRSIEQAARRESTPVNIRFSGYVPEPVEAIRRVDVVVSFSVFAESFGRTIVEAMAAGRPVIAYGSGAAPELVRHGEDGFLVPPRDFPRALEHLAWLADHRHRLAAMGANGRERARRLFSRPAFASQLNAIYRHILARSRSGRPLKPADC
jgi:glycosyltransferase involved in cell wall biosynthesis